MADLNFQHLRYFRAVAHDGNLTRAAERLNLSQSALSIQIRKLEDRLGHQLFERRSRQLHLTEVGRIVLDHADAIFASGDELIEILKGTGKTRQALRVGALSTLSRNFQIRFLAPLLGRADVELIVRSGSPAELFQAIQALSLDIVLTNQTPPSDVLTPLVTHRIDEQHVSLIGRRERLRKARSLEALLKSEPIILPTRGTTIRTGFDALMDRLGIRAQIAAEVDDMAMMRLLTRENVGLAVLPPIVVKDELQSGYLREAAALPDISETFYAVTMSRRFPNPLIRLLLDTLK